MHDHMHAPLLHVWFPCADCHSQAPVVHTNKLHPATHPLPHSPTHSPPLTHSPTHPHARTHSPTHPLTLSPTHPLTHSPTHPHARTCTHIHQHHHCWVDRRPRDSWAVARHRVPAKLIFHRSHAGRSCSRVPARGCGHHHHQHLVKLVGHVVGGWPLGSWRIRPVQHHSSHSQQQRVCVIVSQLNVQTYHTHAQ
jgi:hypothetical protein